MKGKWANKVKADTACVKRQSKVRAATIGLIISMGASNLILTKPSESAPAGDKLALDAIGTSADKAGQAVSYANHVEQESFSTLITAKPLVQLQEVAIVPFAIENKQPARIRVARKASSKLTLAKASASLSGSVAKLDRNIPGKPDRQTRLLQVLRVTRLVRQLKHSQNVAIADRSLLASSEDKTNWTKQRLLIDRLKQPHRLQASQALEESQSSSGVADKTQTSHLQTNQATAASLGLLPGVAPEETARSQQSQQQPTTVYVIPPIATSSQTLFELEKSQQLLHGVNPSSGIAASQEYRVKAGDTLSAIALERNLPLVALIKANHLDDPNRLQINQKLIIPVSQSNSMAQNSDLIAQPQAVISGVNSAYSGMGGEISDDDSVVASAPPNVAEIQRQQSAAAQQLLGDRYTQNLRTDIQKSWQKYESGWLTSQALPDEDRTSDTPATSASANEQLLRQIHSQSATEQPINPEFSSAGATKSLQIDAQKQLPLGVKPTGRSVRVRNGLATAPLGTEGADALRSFQERNVSPALPPLGGVNDYLPNPTSISAKGFIWPARGKLTSGYGWRWGRMHKGVDIAAPIGTPIMAAAPGVVIKAGWSSGGYGNLVDIQHPDGTLTRYGHNKKILVRSGQVVQQGQQISEMGNTGFSTGPHLHFEVHPMGKKAVNPIAYLPR